MLINVTFWWLVEVPYWWNWGCFMNFLGIFFMQHEKYYFCMEGSMQDAHKVRCLLLHVRVHARWLLVNIVVGSTQGGGQCEVRMAVWGDKWASEVKMPTQGENGHMRWEMATPDENVHVGWEWPCEVRNDYTRWKCPCKVRMATRAT